MAIRWANYIFIYLLNPSNLIIFLIIFLLHFSFQIWRSRSKAKELNIDTTNNSEAFDLKLNNSA